MTGINDQERADNLIDQYISGTISKQQLDELTAWTVKSEGNRQYVRERLEIWFSASIAGGKCDFDLETKYRNLRERLTALQSKARKKNTRIKIIKGVVAVAAVALLAVLPFVGYRQGVMNTEAKLTEIRMETPLGSRTKMYLPDGTLVWLNAGSKLAYSQGFGVNNRNVKLVGEAYFEVTHNERLPFEINAKELDLKVLGTRFTYNNYLESKVIKVDLLDGRVFLKNNSDGNGMTLKPNERMIYDKNSGQMWRKSIDTSLSASWTNGVLFFDEMPLEDIAETLTKAYNVRIRVSKRLKNESFYGSFDTKNNSVEDVLHKISTTKKMKYRYENGVYTLY